MNDRYLFKAKRIDNGEWIVGNLLTIAKINSFICTGKIKLDEAVKGRICPEMYAVDESTLCQCTGLKDKEKNLIWENDVVKCIDRNSGAEFIAVVEFGNPNGFYSWGYQLKHIKGDEPNLDILLWVEMEETGATIEVIGSIFDNPELPEVER